MAENSNNDAWFGAGLGLGVVIGGLFMWAIIKSQQSQAPAQSTPAMQSMNLHPPPPPINIYPVIREEAVHLKVPELPGVIEAPGVQSPHEPAIAPTTTYKNNEKWVIERGDDGFIKSLNVVRDAKVNAPA
ncbi:MAG: hypothetical protein Q8P40_13575 [Nitrospirota bacterium]|nr:hypothetical protein [Nitrospirota bacterium]